MGSEKVRYAVGDVGKLFAFTGGDVPAGATPLIEEHDDRLTEAGKTYCTIRGHTPHPELIRVKFAQQTSEAVSEAATATVRNQEVRLDRDAKTKAMSERLRLDWAAQDKGYQEAQKQRK